MYSHLAQLKLTACKSSLRSITLISDEKKTEWKCWRSYPNPSIRCIHHPTLYFTDLT